MLRADGNRVAALILEFFAATVLLHRFHDLVDALFQSNSLLGLPATLNRDLIDTR